MATPLQSMENRIVKRGRMHCEDNVQELKAPRLSFVQRQPLGDANGRESQWQQLGASSATLCTSLQQDCTISPASTLSEDSYAHDNKENTTPGAASLQYDKPHQQVHSQQQGFCCSSEDPTCNTMWDDEEGEGPSSQLSTGSLLSTQVSIDLHLGDPLASAVTSSCKLAARRRSFALSGLSVDTEARPAAPAHHTMHLQQHPQQQQAAQLLAQQSAHIKAKAGWFSRCRGCAQLTGHEYTTFLRQHKPGAAAIPMCACCSRHLALLEPQCRAAQEEQLLHIHTSWMQHGI